MTIVNPVQLVQDNDCKIIYDTLLNGLVDEIICLYKHQLFEAL